MSNRHAFEMGEGPFRADQVRPGDPYEISRGHPILCAPTGRDGAVATLVGGAVLDSDPDVDRAGIDLGVAVDAKTLRAPDIAVGNVEDRPGWSRTAPPLAVEYASVGQDEDELRIKIDELLGAGTRWIWVVRLLGNRRVEVHAAGEPMIVRYIGEQLTAPGVLRNPVPVEALFDRDVGFDIVLRNLLQRRGYDDIEGVLAAGREEGREAGREEGREEGREAGALEAARRMLVAIIEARGLPLADAARDCISACTETDQLQRWAMTAAVHVGPVDFIR
ncbi:Uma2 family endonuclease [Myxococcota bacterium]|nr:Uma2 family endonuclease [Myxococcota bacterium]